MDHAELTKIADDMYANETTYLEWRHNCGDFSHSPHEYALEMVAFWSDPGLGEEQLVLDDDERDIVVNMIEEKARRELV